MRASVRGRRFGGLSVIAVVDQGDGSQYYTAGMPLFSETEGPAPERAATATVGMMMNELISAARADQVVYLTGPGDEASLVGWRSLR